MGFGSGRVISSSILLVFPFFGPFWVEVDFFFVVPGKGLALFFYGTLFPNLSSTFISFFYLANFFWRFLIPDNHFRYIALRIFNIYVSISKKKTSIAAIFNSKN